MQVNYWCDAGPTGLLSLDDLGFGWDLLAMSRYWLLLHFPFSLWFRQHHFWVTLDNQQLRCHLQSTLCCTKGCIRFSPRKEHLDQLLLPFGTQTPLDFRAVGHWEGGRKGRITWSLYCPLLDGSRGAVQRTGHTVRRKSWSLTVREPMSRGNAVHKREWIMQNVRLTSVLFCFFFPPPGDS